MTKTVMQLNENMYHYEIIHWNTDDDNFQFTSKKNNDSYNEAISCCVLRKKDAHH